MRRAVFCIVATVVAVWRILAYDVPATSLAASSARQLPTEMTLPDDANSEGGDSDSDAIGAGDDTSSNDTEDPAAVATVDPAPGAPVDTTTTVAPHAVQQPTTPTTKATTATTAKPVATTSPAPPTTPKPTTTVAPKRTFTGVSADSGYGAVVVTITVQGTKIVGVSGSEAATDPTSKTISSGAIPKLQSATLTAQSATFDNVSGATFTSKAWKTSLSSALGAAGL